MHKIKNWNFCCNRIKRISRLYLNGGYTGIIYPLYVSLSGKLLKMGETHIGDMAIMLSLII